MKCFRSCKCIKMVALGGREDKIVVLKCSVGTIDGFLVSVTHVDRSGMIHYTHIRKDLARWYSIFMIFECACIDMYTAGGLMVLSPHMQCIFVYRHGFELCMMYLASNSFCEYMWITQHTKCSQLLSPPPGCKLKSECSYIKQIGITMCFIYQNERVYQRSNGLFYPQLLLSSLVLIDLFASWSQRI